MHALFSMAYPATTGAMYVTGNTTMDVTKADVTTEADPWLEFGTLQIFEVIFLTLLTVLGTIGNLVVIFSIALERRVHAHGNIFIINLAVADLIVTGFIVPTVIANVIHRGNALGSVPTLCDIVGYLVTATCTCSLCNLMFIAINRFWAVVRPNTYAKTFSRKRVYYMMALTWIWSALLVSPTTFGWGDLKYDKKIMVCTWDDIKDRSYTFFVTICAIFVPLCIIGFCYYKLFSTVRSSGRWVRSLSVGSGISQNTEQHRRSMRKEQSLLRTLATTVVLFCVFWVPFGACVLINPEGTPAHAKKLFGWFALSNSCVNFIIYGAMNPVFRRGYHNLFIFLFRCKRAHKISSTMLHGSFSDSFKAIRKVSKPDDQRNGRSRSHNNRSKAGANDCMENSRADTITALQTQTTLATNSPAFLRNVKAIVTTNGPVTPENPHEIVASAQKIQLGGEENFFEEDEFAREARFSRRAMSDTPLEAKSARSDDMEQCNENANCNREIERRCKNGSGPTYLPLRGTWMPESTVYRSRDSVYISPVKRSQSAKCNGTYKHPFHRNDISTVCGRLYPEGAETTVNYASKSTAKTACKKETEIECGTAKKNEEIDCLVQKSAPDSQSEEKESGPQTPFTRSDSSILLQKRESEN